MEIIELKVQVDKSQLDSLQQEIAKFESKEFSLKFKVTGLDDIKNLTNAQAKAVTSANNLATAQAKATAAMHNAAAAAAKASAELQKAKRAESQYNTQVEKTATAEEQARTANTNLSTQIEKTRTEREKQTTAEKQYALQVEKTNTVTEQTKLQQEKTATAAQNLEVQQEKTATAAQNLATAQEKNAGATQKAGDEMKKTAGFASLMGDSFGNIVKKMALWQILGNAIASVKRAFTDALDTMQAVDDQLVTIRKVTGNTASEMAVIEQQAYKTASAYGVAADEYLESVAEFARAGYEDQSSSLAELATKTQIVGDTTAEVANQMLLAVDAAYQYEGSIEKLSAVLDGMNEIDNKYATSIEDIASGLGKVAPIASQVHVGIDELSAAIGTITAVTQRSGTEAATALRALFLNIVGDTKTEIDEGVTWTTGEIAGLQDLLKVYAADAYEAAAATGSVIDPMEAIAALSQSMKEGLLTEQELMETVSDIGGKLRTSQLLALIQNWDMYESMLADYQNAAGSADKEIENAMDSWSRKVEVLKNTWTEFISNTVNSDWIKNGIDALTWLVDGFDNLGVALASVGAASAAVNFDRITESITKWASSISPTSAALTALTVALAAATVAYNKWLQALEDAAAEDLEAAQAANDHAQSIIGLYGEYKNAEDGTQNLTDAALALAEALGVDASEGVDTLIGKLDELTDAEIKATQGTAAAAKASTGKYVESMASALGNEGRIGSLYEKGSAIYRDGIASQYSDVMDLYNEVLNSQGYKDYYNNATADEITEYYDKLVALRDLMQEIGAEDDRIFDSKLYDDVTNSISYLTDAVNQYKAALESVQRADAMQILADDLKSIDIDDQASFDSYIQSIQNSTEYSEAFKAILIEIANDAFPQYSGEAEAAADATNDAADAAESATTSFETLMSTLKGLATDLGTVSDVFEDFADDGALTFTTLADVADAFGELSNISEYINLLAQAGNTAADVQAIMAQMTVQLIQQKVAAGELTAADYALVAAMLQEVGVANAEQVALALVNGAAVTATGGINAFATAVGNASGTTLDTSGTVSNLYAAGDAGYYAAQGILAYKSALSNGSVSGGSVATGSANGVGSAKKKVELNQANLKDGGTSKPSLSAIGKTTTTKAKLNSGQIDISDFWNETMQNLANGVTTGSGGSGGGGGGGGGGSGSGSSTDPWEEAKDNLEDYLDEAERAIEVHEREGASLESLTGEYDEMMGEISDLIDQYRESTGVEEDDFINQLKLLWWDYYDTVKEVITEANKEALEAADAIVDEVLESAKEAASSSSSSSSGGGSSSSGSNKDDIEEKQKALENAKNERTVRYYNAATGQWEWMADQDAVEDAEEALKDAQSSGSSGGGGSSRSSSSSSDTAYDKFEAAWNKVKEAVEDGSMTLKEAYDYMAEVVEEIAEKYSVDFSDTLAKIGAAFDLEAEIAVDNFDKTWEEVQAAVASGAMTAEDAFTQMATLIRDIGIKYSTDLSDQLQTIANALGIGADSLIQIVAQISGIEFAEGATDEEMTAAIIERMKSNSAAWNSATTDEQRNTYSTENSMLGNALGWTRTDGVWYTADGVRAYDSGGILRGLGGIKATADDEMVLGPELTDKLLNPVEDSRFNQVCAKLEYLFGSAGGATSLRGTTTTRNSNDHYGDVYNLPGGITISGKQAESMTLAQLVRTAGGLGIYKNA